MMWSKNKNLVIWKDNNGVSIFDETALRNSMSSYLSDESRNRFGKDEFCSDSIYLDGLKWYLEGLSLLLK